MGRKFLASRVAQTARQRLQNPLLSSMPIHTPVWLNAVEKVAPAEVFTRTVPIAHQPPNPKLRKPKHTYRPQQITYEEDELRQTFFRDHPWELARPRVILEADGLDSRRYDWSKGLYQPGMPLCGESVVQRQMWFMQNGMTKEQAYDSARREFYALRQREEVERRVAVEEARMVGAYFGKTALQVSMGLEDETYEMWKAWAGKQTAKLSVLRKEAYTDFGNSNEESSSEEGAAPAKA